MPDSVQQRVARRYIGREVPAVVVAHVDAHDVPWGWTSPHLRRMHIMPLAVTHRGLVWLEDRSGNRAFVVALEDPSFDSRQLRASVAQSRDAIEREWLRWCDARGWLEYSLSSQHLCLYPGTDHELSRSLIDPSLLHDEPDWTLGMPVAALNRLMWKGADDGRDATP